LERHLAEAREQVESLRKHVDDASNPNNRRQRKAKERAARERVERLEAAKQQLADMEQQAEKSGRAAKNKKAGKEMRVSETDPQARVMKMANGGFNPAYNAQFCTDTGSNIVTGVQVWQQGNDAGLASPMLDEIYTQQGQMPEETLNDTGYYSSDDVVAITQKGCTPYIAIPNIFKSKGQAENEPDLRYVPRSDDPPAMAALRLRMASQEAHERLVKRSAVAELVHAALDQCGLSRMRVRGIAKVKTVLLWFVLVHNWIRTRLLRKMLSLAAATSS